MKETQVIPGYMVPGEIVALRMETLKPLIPQKVFKKLQLLKLVDTEGEEFIQCIFEGTVVTRRKVFIDRTKHIMRFKNSNGYGVKYILNVLRQVAGNDKQEFIATGIIMKFKQKTFQKIIIDYWGIVQGTSNSLPNRIHIPPEISNGIDIPFELHRHCKEKYNYINNTKKNIKAAEDSAKNGKNNTIMIYGAPFSGKTCLASHIAEQIGKPWIRISSKFSVFPPQIAAPVLSYLASLCSERRVTILFDDLDELMGMFFIPSANVNDGVHPRLAMLATVNSIISDCPTNIIITLGGNKNPIDHIISSCDILFSTNISHEEAKEVWNLACPEVPDMAREIAEESLPIALIYKVANQARAIAKSRKRKRATKADVKSVLNCMGTQEESKLGFSVGEN